MTGNCAARKNAARRVRRPHFKERLLRAKRFPSEACLQKQRRQCRAGACAANGEIQDLNIVRDLPRDEKSVTIARFLFSDPTGHFAVAQHDCNPTARPLRDFGIAGLNRENGFDIALFQRADTSAASFSDSSNEVRRPCGGRNSHLGSARQQLAALRRR